MRVGLDQQLFSKKILLFHQDIKDQEDLFKILDQKLLDQKVVNDGFLKAITTREKSYPTGLKLESGFGVAIPHTDPKYVNENQIGFLSLNKPVQFRQMGSSTEVVDVKMVFILCLKEAHQQLAMLQNLMAIFGDNKMVDKLYQCTSADEFLKLIC
ncbi:MAG TPA: PTS sugar transporter subunit IIA [Lactobacillus acetotolerans]|jgi:PTS system galactitol-specific IIA component|nr:PTS sugar transporter subunit IIA [Lactobacillus acetotolerans]